MVPIVCHAALSGALAHDHCCLCYISSTEAVHCVHIAKPPPRAVSLTNQCGRVDPQI